MIGGKQRAANAKKEEKKGKAAESDKIPVKSDSASSLKPKSCAFHIPIFPFPFLLPLSPNGSPITQSSPFFFLFLSSSLLGGASSFTIGCFLG